MKPSGVRRPLNGRDELVNALENIMPYELLTIIWDYDKLPSKVPEEFVNAISHVMCNDLTLIIWEYVMCPALDLCRICDQAREEQNDRQVCTTCIQNGNEDRDEDCCDVCLEIGTVCNELEERHQCPFCKSNWYHLECAEYWGQSAGILGDDLINTKRVKMNNDSSCQRYRDVIIENFNEDPTDGHCNLYDCVIRAPGYSYSIHDLIFD
jgi:hypothetical protein